MEIGISCIALLRLSSTVRGFVHLCAYLLVFWIINGRHWEHANVTIMLLIGRYQISPFLTNATGSLMQVGVEIPIDSEEADDENKDERGRTLLNILGRGSVAHLLNICHQREKILVSIHLRHSFSGNLSNLVHHCSINNDP